MAPPRAGSPISHGAPAEGDIAVARGVDDNVRGEAQNAALGREVGTGDPVAVHHRGKERRVEKHPHPGLGAKVVENELQGFRLEGGDMVVPRDMPGGEGRPGAHLRGVDGAASGHHAAHDLVEEPANQLRLSALVVARHEGADEAARGHAAEAATLLGEDDAGAAARGGNGGAHAGGTAADDENAADGHPYLIISTKGLTLRHVTRTIAGLVAAS